MTKNTIFWNVIYQRKPIVNAQLQFYNFTVINVKINVSLIEAD